MESSESNSSTLQIPSAFKFLFQPARRKAAFGGRGASKSHAFAAALITLAYQRPLRVLCCREIQRSIKDSVKRLLDDKIEAANLKGFFESTDQEINGANGSLFIFAGLRTNIDTLKSVEGSDIAWVEEANSVSKNSLDLLIPTIRKPDSELWFSWNPRYATDPVDAMFRSGEPPPDSIIREISWRDNPWFPDVLRKEMEWDRRRDPDKFLHVWQGGYLRNSEARVFKNWRVGDPAEFQPKRDTRFYFGGDWGFAQDPSVLVRCWIEGRTLFVDYEAYAIGCDIDFTPFLFGGFADDKLKELNAEAWKKLSAAQPAWKGIPAARLWPIRADSARPETIRYMQTHGFPRMVAAKKGAGSVEEGVEFLKSYDIVIHPRCTHAVDELTMYSYKVDPLTGQILPILEDKKNHCIAEGVLVTTNRGQIPIEEVTVKDRVLTRGGFMTVLFSGQTDTHRDVVEVRTTHGSVYCTPDHEIFTNRGFVRADALRYCDELVVDPGAACVDAKPSNITATAITDIQTVGHRSGDTSGAVCREARFYYIDRFGKTRTEQFRELITFITSTGTRLIIRSTIWNVFQGANIYTSIRSHQNDSLRQERISTEFGRSRRLGIAAKRGGESTLRLAAWRIRITRQLRSLALHAQRCFFPAQLEIATAFAPINASPHGDARLDAMTKCELASNVPEHSNAINTPALKLAAAHVLTVSAHGNAAKVYDLTVGSHHEFFANGILVSNCIDSLRYATEDARQPGLQIF